MENEVNPSDALDKPQGLAPAALPEPNLDIHLSMDCLEETFVIKPSLGEQCKEVDITNYKNHLTPDKIREGGDDWIEFYWTMVNLLVPGEKTLVDPRDPTIVFASNFFEPDDWPQYDMNDRFFQQWLLEWRTAAQIEHYGPEESEGNAVPTREEVAAYRNLRQRHLLNLENSFGTQTCIYYELFIMWDFNASAAAGECTSPRVSVSNIRFLFDVVDAIPEDRLDRLFVFFVFKDVRQGRYTHVADFKRRYDNDTRLSRQWTDIIEEAIAESRQLSQDLENGLYPNIDAITPLKWDIARNARRKISKTFGRNNLSRRGQLKYMMFDTFKESRCVRRQDPDVRRWLRDA